MTKESGAGGPAFQCLMDRGAGRLSRQAKHKNILFTGVPGIGKSTIIEKIVQRINRSKTGFYTREMRASGRRVGFTITTLDGERGTLAHIDIPGHMRVGRYGVNLPDIDLIVSLKGDAFIGAVKKRPDTLLISVNKKNRDDLVEEFFARMTDGKSSSVNRMDLWRGQISY